MIRGSQMSDSDVSIVRSAYAAFGQGDIPGVMNVLGEQVEWRAPDVLPHGGAFEGLDGVEEFFQGIGEKWEELHVDAREFLDAGSEVVVLGQATGRLRGIGAADYLFAHVFTVANGKVTRFREYVDPGEAMRG
jgi:ketosteroid isomerase-like protein